MKRLFIRISILVVTTITTSVGCATKFVLPPQSGEMEEVFLLSYSSWGHHSLAFHTNSTLVEFTYGDWDLFALNRRDGWTAWTNMTFLTQGALGRKIVTWSPGSQICPKFKDCLDARSFLAPAFKTRKLYERLQKSYAERVESEVLNEVEQVYFVKYDVSYWGFHNCNHEVADWLEELGGTVSGRVFLNPDFIGGMVGH